VQTCAPAGLPLKHC